jgi:hypothetical protein
MDEKRDFSTAIPQSSFRSRHLEQAVNQERCAETGEYLDTGLARRLAGALAPEPHLVPLKALRGPKQSCVGTFVNMIGVKLANIPKLCLMHAKYDPCEGQAHKKEQHDRLKNLASQAKVLRPSSQTTGMRSCQRRP